MTHNRFLRDTGLLTVIGLVLSAYTYLPHILADWVATPPGVGPADAIVVLANNIQPDGSLSDTSFRLAVHGVVLHRQGLAPLLVFSGVARPDGLSEAKVRVELATRLGVPPAAILTETRVHTTRDEALRMRERLGPLGARSVLLVADSLHMARARAAFERAGLAVRPASVEDPRAHSANPLGRLLLTWHVARESAARLYYRLAGYA